jgi:hypothetical protein
MDTAPFAVAILVAILLLLLWGEREQFSPPFLNPVKQPYRTWPTHHFH